MERVSNNLFHFFIIFIQIPNSSTLFSFFKSVIPSILLGDISGGSRIKHNFFVQLLLVYFERVLVLPFEWHLQGAVCAVDQLAKII